MIINIEKLNYSIKHNEFEKINHREYNHLKLYNDIGLFERIIGLIKKLKECFDQDIKFISYDTTHGGFIPINLIEEFTTIYICQYDIEHITHIKHNINHLIFNKNKNKLCICHSENNFTGINNISLNISQDHILFHDITQCIFITKHKLQSIYLIEYELKDTLYYVYVGSKKHSTFINIFKYSIKENNILIFDNLINLCIMVKNGGPQFEQMLTANLHLIDTWTILDTGSTDNTIDIINNVLVGKKYGNLYQEPFINFRDSRNRLLELAGTKCKFNLMLDDTYIIKGDLREFLNEIRSDQYSNSFTLYIHSDDTKYGSNRITKSNSGLKYIHTIHEVITQENNINIIIPENRAYISDEKYDYMNKRTMDRKQLDLKLLFEEINEDPNNPRAYYYLAQTYVQLEDYEKAFFYFIQRYNFSNSGYIQERVDAAFEAARIANFKLNKPWDECEKLYNNAFKIDESRPESLYFIGIHYYLENNYNKAYIYFKQAFEIGFPIHCQYSLKPTLSFHFLPTFLSRICYGLNDYKLGFQSAELYLQHNNHTSENYEELLSWHKIYKKLNIYTGPKIPKIPNKPILCFVSDYHLTNSGIGCSETYIIEISKYIKQHTFFEQIIVFCNTPEEKDIFFEGVNYQHSNKYYECINNNYIHTCIVSQFSEYLPVTLNGFVENVYFVVHDLRPSGIVIPINPKLKNIFCLNQSHSTYLSNIFPTLKHIIVPFYCDIDDEFTNININQFKETYQFIYSKLSWNKQANILLNEYILKNNLEYKNIYNWTHNLPEGTKEIFLKIIEYFNNNHIDKETKILEIGTYTGISLIHIIKLIPNSIGYGLDKWKNSETQIDTLQIEKSFYNNIHNEGLSNRIFGIKSSSTDKLIEFIKNNTQFNFININGSHLLDCYTDFVNSWYILEKGGIIVIDYLYKKDENVLHSPFEAVNHFLKVFEGNYKILHIGYRIFLEKI